jgi:hypothetical protein
MADLQSAIIRQMLVNRTSACAANVRLRPALRRVQMPGVLGSL